MFTIAKNNDTDEQGLCQFWQGLKSQGSVPQPSHISPHGCLSLQSGDRLDEDVCIKEQRKTVGKRCMMSVLPEDA